MSAWIFGSKRTTQQSSGCSSQDTLKLTPNIPMEVWPSYIIFKEVTKGGETRYVVEKRKELDFGHYWTNGSHYYYTKVKTFTNEKDAREYVLQNTKDEILIREQIL